MLEEGGGDAVSGLVKSEPDVEGVDDFVHFEIP